MSLQMANLPRAILFDLDDTIISYSPRQLILVETAKEFTDALAPLAPNTVADAIDDEFKSFWADPGRNRSWRVRIKDASRSMVSNALTKLQGGHRPQHDELAHRLADRFLERREREMSFFPQAIETIDALRICGVRLALVTNGASETQRLKIRRFDLMRRFDHIQVEEEAGFGKPDPRAYRRALQVLDVHSHQAWMVGDHLEFDVAAPQCLGIQGIWHDHLGRGLPPHTSVKPDRIISRLRELLT
jgi:putative hydrolase of the HAD superfamily